MPDTDICFYAIKQSNVTVQRRLEQVSVKGVCVSVVSKAELLYSLALSATPEKHRSAMERFLQYTQVLAYPERAAAHYAEIRAALTRSGQMIGANDLFLAAQAWSLA